MKNKTGRGQDTEGRSCCSPKRELSNWKLWKPVQLNSKHTPSQYTTQGLRRTGSALDFYNAEDGSRQLEDYLTICDYMNGNSFL